MAHIAASALRKITINLPKDDIVTITMDLEDLEGNITIHEYNLQIINEANKNI